MLVDISPALSSLFLFLEVVCLVSSDLTVSGFKLRKKRGVIPKADKGKPHNYPKKRKARHHYPKVRVGKDGRGYQLPMNVFVSSKINFSLNPQSVNMSTGRRLGK